MANRTWLYIASIENYLNLVREELDTAAAALSRDDTGLAIEHFNETIRKAALARLEVRALKRQLRELTDDDMHDLRSRDHPFSDEGREEDPPGPDRAENDWRGALSSGVVHDSADGGAGEPELVGGGSGGPSGDLPGGAGHLVENVDYRVTAGVQLGRIGLYKRIVETGFGHRFAELVERNATEPVAMQRAEVGPSGPVLGRTFWARPCDLELHP